VGNRISQTDANGNVTKFSYDRLGRRATRTLPLSNAQSEAYGYDAVGNLTSKKDFNGHATTYQYDTLNRLTSKIADAFFSTGACAGGACGATQVGFTYSATSRRLSMTDAGNLIVGSYRVAALRTSRVLPSVLTRGSLRESTRKREIIHLEQRRRCRG